MTWLQRFLDELGWEVFLMGYATYKEYEEDVASSWFDGDQELWQIWYEHKELIWNLYQYRHAEMVSDFNKERNKDVMEIEGSEHDPLGGSHGWYTNAVE